MKHKKIVLLLLGLGVILAILGFVLSKTSIDNKTNHMDEFDIVNSKYFERNYERYKGFKKSHKEYTDDQIITLVNLSMDKNNYTDPETVNEDDGILMFVSKHYKIREDYVPNLIEVGPLKALLEENAAKSFNEMAEAAKIDANLFPLKAYMTYDEIDSLYQISQEENGEKYTENYYAKSGYSEYQTGLSVDISGNTDTFKYSKEYAWLEEHAYEYGFILRYPEKKEYITGFDYKPWQYRYVGKEAAKEIHDKNITFDEYYVNNIMK